MGLWRDVIDGYKVSRQISKDAKAAEDAKKKSKADQVAKPNDQLASGVGAIADNMRKKKAELQTN